MPAANTFLVPEGGLLNDNTGTIVGIINADTDAVTILNTKVQALINLGANAFVSYPLTIGTDIPKANESNYVANDNSGNMMSILNNDTSSTKLANAKLAGPLLTAVVAGAGIDVTAAPGSGAGTQTISIKGGKGSSPILEDVATETELTTTTATTVVTYTPTATDLFRISGFVRVLTAATNITVTATWNDAAGTAQTATLVPTTSLPVGDYPLPPTVIAAGTGGAINLKVTAGTASQCYASGAIELL